MLLAVLIIASLVLLVFLFVLAFAIWAANDDKKKRKSLSVKEALSAATMQQLEGEVYRRNQQES